MARVALDQYLYLLDEAFSGDDWHSLLSNLKDLELADWLWVPAGGARPIAEMVSHLAACKNMYRDHAFGGATMKWSDPAADQKMLTTATPEAVALLLAFLHDAQSQLRGAVDALGDDAELFRERRTNRGGSAETRWIIKALIEHDLYHAGEINRLRSLRRGNDRWAFERFG